MSDQILKRFGRYILLDRVAQGGMAEIFRARASAPDGGGRILVIKRIQSNYRSNKEFLEMFKAEIKFTMGFNHPNIVALYDYGDSEGTPYIAMEYVDGKTVRQFAGRFFKRKELLPVDLVLSIIEQTARGLAYAHGYRDKMTGDELHIVHRDISPQNLIISYDGVVKLIDFGIAKARTSANLTRTGIIKGKPSYMSPEQVHGEDLDGRGDIFSLGIVLWELLTGKKLFSTTGKSEYTVLKMIENCEKIVKPPSILNAAIKPELDEIVLRALAKRREDRFQSAAEFQRALQKHLIVNFPDHNISEIPYWMDRLFGEDKKTDQLRLRDLNSQAENLSESEGHEGGIADVHSEVIDPERLIDFPKSDHANANPVADRSSNTLNRVLEKDIRHGQAPSTVVQHSDSDGNLVGFNGVSASESRALQLEAFGKSPVPQELSRMTSRSPRRGQTEGGASRRSRFYQKVGSYSFAALTAALVIFPEALVRIPFVGDVVVGGRQVIGELQSGKRYVPFLSEVARSFRLSAERLPASTGKSALITASPGPAAVRNSVFMTLRVTPAGLGTKITINGKSVWTPVPVIELPLDSKIEMVVERRGFKPFTKEFFLTPMMFKGSSEYRYDVSLEPEVFGFLSVRGNLSSEVYVRELDSLSKSVNEVSSTWYFKSRFDQQKFPPGTYLVQLTNRALELEAEETVRVEKGLISRVSAELANTPASALNQLSPDRVVGLLGWFRAGSITGVREHDVIENWNDSSKNLNQNFQKDPVKRPVFLGSAVNGRAVLNFDGRSSGFDTETLAGQLRGLKTLTVLYVTRLHASKQGEQTVLGCFTNNHSRTVFEVGFDSDARIMIREGATKVVSPDRSLASDTSGAGPGQFGIYSTVITGSSVIAHENGLRKVNTQGSEVDFSSTAICSIGEGWTNTQTRSFLNGDVAEILVYDHALSVREQDSIERYLSQLYKIPITK